MKKLSRYKLRANFLLILSAVCLIQVLALAEIIAITLPLTLATVLYGFLIGARLKPEKPISAIGNSALGGFFVAYAYSLPFGFLITKRLDLAFLTPVYAPGLYIWFVIATVILLVLPFRRELVVSFVGVKIADMGVLNSKFVWLFTFLLSVGTGLATILLSELIRS